MGFAILPNAQSFKDDYQSDVSDVPESQHFWAFKLHGFDGKFVLLGDLLLAGAVPWVPWGKVPKFIPTFESVGRVPERDPQRLAAKA